MKFRQYASLMLAAIMLLLTLTACFGADTTGGTSSTTKPSGSETTTKPNGAQTTTKPTTDTTKPGDAVTPTPTGDWLDGYLDKMPVFNITTDGGAPIVSKEEYIGGKLTVDCSDEALELTDAVIEIRGRGNFSWLDVEKKSYRIKFAEKTNLLGQGAGPARSWTLLAVHCDQSLLRNAAALTLAGKLSGIDYSSSVRFAQVYLNGEYSGVYQVSEQMQAQKYRVPIDDKETTASEIDFLVELDTQAKDVVVRDGFGNTYEVKSDTWNGEQVDYIEFCIDVAFESVSSGAKDEVLELIDIDSVIDAYLVEELFKNLDAGWGSFYMYQTVGGKLHFGPVWDFDLAAGNADANDKNPTFPSPEYIYVGSDAYGYAQSHPWFIELCQQDWFHEMVKARWFEVQDIIKETPNYIRRVATLYSDDFDKNFERWPIFGQKINREPAAVQALKNHDEHAEYAAKWLEQRIAWLNDYFNGKVSGEPEKPSSEFKGSGGTGTKNDPFLVSNEKDFYQFTYVMTLGETFRGKYIKQTADIDMANYFGYNGIGAVGNFEGTYNGNGYKINAVIRGQDECIFPYVSGTVMNVTTTGSVSNGAQAAGIARSVRRSGTIVNCISFMEVTSYFQAAAGITASNQSGGGTVSGCLFFGKLICEAREGETGAINIFIEGRGGEFNNNYCLDTSVGTSVGNETKVTANEAKTLATTLNQKLQTLTGGADKAALCEWQTDDNGLPALKHK